MQPRIASLWPVVEKLSLCQLFFCFLKMKKMDLRPFCFKAKIFSSQIYLNAIFLYFLRFFILTKNLNAAHTPTEMKQNLCIDFFCYFCQVINKHQSRWVESFSQSRKGSFLNDDDIEYTEKTILVLCSWMIIHYFVWLQITTNMCNFKFKEGVKLV